MLLLPLVSALAAAPIHLQALTATSGTGAENLLDGKADTGWRPEGDATDEGVLFRFEAPTHVGAIDIVPCGGSFTLAVFFNGVEYTEVWLNGTRPARVTVTSHTLMSLFLGIVDHPAPKDVCIAEVRFSVGNDERLAVAPPRRVAGSVSASSTLTPAPAYHPSYLFDNSLDFGWVEGAKGPGVGESVTIQLDTPLALTALEIWNGYQRSEVHFKKNARAKKIAVSLDDGAPIPFDLKDAEGAQKLALPKPVTAKKIHLLITAVYPGTKYPDMVISELRFWDSDGPVSVDVKDRAELRRALDASVAKTPIASLLGRHVTNYFGKAFDRQPTRRTLKLRPDHTFVEYQDSEEKGISSTEVLDGTWVLTGVQGPWAEIEIYGRRHRTDVSCDPYCEDADEVKETDRIAGGRIRFARLAELPASERQQLETLDTGGGADLVSTNKFKDVVVAKGPPLTDFFHAP